MINREHAEKTHHFHGPVPLLLPPAVTPQQLLGIMDGLSYHVTFSQET